MTESFQPRRRHHAGEHTRRRHAHKHRRGHRRSLLYRAENSDVLRQVYDEINSLEKSQFEVETFTTRELATWAMAAGLLMLLGDLCLRSTWLRGLP